MKREAVENSTNYNFVQTQHSLEREKDTHTHTPYNSKRNEWVWSSLRAPKKAKKEEERGE